LTSNEEKNTQDEKSNKKPAKERVDVDLELAGAKKRRRRSVLALSLMTGTLITIWGILENSGKDKFILDAIAKNPLVYIGGFIITFTISQIEFFDPRKFIDIDKASFDFLSKKLSPEDAWPFPTNDPEDIDQRLIYENISKLDLHIYKMLEFVQAKITEADTKASMLLDKGTAYARYGVIFFATSIIIWQALSLTFGFHEYYIYGIASCSGLFIFVEVISAWFLRQYRHFVDVSVYLLKIKSIFDKFMLSSLLAEKFSITSDDAKKETMNRLFEMFSQPIQWPDTYISKDPDIGMFKDSMESIASILKELKPTKKDS